MQKAKETATDVAASAKAGMEKTKATLGEKAEKMSTSDPARKEMAERKKEERIYEAEREKQGMRDAARRGPGYHPTGYSAEAPPLSEDYPTGVTTRGVVGSQYPATGAGRTGVLDPDREELERDREDRAAGLQDPRVGGGARTGHGAGSTY